MGQAVRSYAKNEGVCCDTKSQVRQYWTKRSHDFAELKERELGSPIALRWAEEIEPHLPVRDHLRILDVGTGSGFFAFLLDAPDREVIGIDLTSSMIEEAKRIGQESDSHVRFRVMDAEKLLFGDESFDVVISRNLTWTLPDPKAAYREWFRVLKPGGVLLNFDANYGVEDFTKDDQDLPANHAHKQMDRKLSLECERIKDQLEISFYSRPAWDVETLQEIGFETIELDLGISKKVYREIDEFYNPTPMFFLKAGKKR